MKKSVKYRGLDRGPIKDWDKGSAGEIRLAELKENGEAGSDLMISIISKYENAQDVLRWVEQECPGEYEIVWARVAGQLDTPPKDFVFLGYEPSFFPDGYFSVISNSLSFPVFLKYFEQLNQNDLFDSSKVAKEFLDYYCSFDWTETGPFEIAKIWAKESVAKA